MSSNHRASPSDQPNRIRWTAYALDQLDAAERAEVEAELASDEETRRVVAETRALAEQLRAEAGVEAAAVEASGVLRAALEQSLGKKEGAPMKADHEPSTEPKSPPPTPARPMRRRWIALAAAAGLAAALVPLYLAITHETYAPRETALNSADSGASRTLRSDTKAEPKKPIGYMFESQLPGMPEGGPAHDVADAKREARAELTATNERRDAEVTKEIDPSRAAAVEAGQDLQDERSKFSADRGRFTKTEGELAGKLEGRRIEDATTLGPAGLAPGAVDGYYRPGVSPGGKPVTGPAGPGYTNAKPAEATTPPPAAQPMPEGKPGQPRLESNYRVMTLKEADSLLARTGDRIDYLRDFHEIPPGMMPEGRGLGTEQYEPIAENSFCPVGEQPQSTFSIDVDTASYANVRRFLTQGMWPPADAVRIEEMVNYFKYDYPLPTGDAPFSVDMEVAQCPWNAGNRLLRVGLKGEEIDRKQRGLSNLVFLLDVSGSMSDQNKLPLVKQAMAMLVQQLDENDRVAIVTYAGSTGVHLESTNGENREKILSSIAQLQPGGSTNGGAGIKLAYEQAVRYFIEGGTNRVILCTDGDLNVGITRDDDLVKLIKEKAASGVFLTVLGFGTGNLKDGKLEKLADHGNGIYAYIDSLREAQKVLVEQLTGSLITIAKDVKLQIEFNPAEVAAYRLIGYENRVMAARDFHDDKKDAGEIGAGHTVTALYELVPTRADEDKAAPSDDTATNTSGKLKYQRGPKVQLTKAAKSGELLTLSLRYKEPDAQKSKLLEFTARDSNQRIGEASKDFQFASAVAAFGMILRNSQHRGQATLSAVEEIAAPAVGEDPGGYRAEFVDLVRRAKQIRP